MRTRRLSALLILLMASSTGSANPALPQGVQVIARALSFTEGSSRTKANIAIVYNGSQPSSRAESEALLRLLSGGLRVGDMVLSATELEQSRLGSASAYDAVISVAGVDQAALSRFLSQSGTPCFTLDARQVSEGACTVAVRTAPTVSISLNSQNAAAAGVRFATAFVMMVREI